MPDTLSVPRLRRPGLKKLDLCNGLARKKVKSAQMISETAAFQIRDLKSQGREQVWIARVLQVSRPPEVGSASSPRFNCAILPRQRLATRLSIRGVLGATPSWHSLSCRFDASVDLADARKIAMAGLRAGKMECVGG
jgi:hypothetical protein